MQISNASQAESADFDDELEDWQIDRDQIELTKVIGAGEYGEVWKGTSQGALVLVISREFVEWRWWVRESKNHPGP